MDDQMETDDEFKFLWIYDRQFSQFWLIYHKP